MKANLSGPEIAELVEQRKWTELRALLANTPAPEIVDLLVDQEKYHRVLLFRSLPRAVAAEVFAHLEGNDRDALLKDLTNQETRELLANLSPDDRTHLFEELPGRMTQRLLNVLSPEDLREARQLLGYPEDSVGRLMTPDYVAVRPSWTIGQALEHIRAKGATSETIDVIYVTDESWELIDALDLRRFILADPQTTVQQIMDYSFVSLSPFDDRERVVETMQRYDLLVLPVVDSEGVLLGIVTIDDVLDVAQEEATEDFQRVAAVSPLGISYHEASIWSLYSKRIVWLAALVVVSLISSGIIAAYEQTLASAIALAFFIPLLIGSGGNTGSQSATLMIRALAVGDVELHEWGSTLAKELMVGIALGVTMGLSASVLGLIRGGVEIGIVVGLTMVAVVLVANLIGTTLPFLLTRLGWDPAMASSPLIASIADAAGLLIYFTVATFVLSAVGVS